MQTHQARGGATLQALVVACVFCAVLGAFGPALDADAHTEPAPTDPALAHELREQEARGFCTQLVGPNSGWRTAPDGSITCTDKHGRVPRGQVTVLQPADPR